MTEHDSSNPTEKQDALRYERAEMQFLEAYDQDDFEILVQLWQAAEADEKLEQILCELNDGLLHEHGASNEEPENAVLPILRQTMPSAFMGNDEPAITAAHVAAAISADRVTMQKLSSSDQEANRQLLTAHVELPTNLGGSAIKTFSQELSIAASQHYWRAFQQAALLLRMSRAGDSRAAARPAKAPRTSRRRSDKE